MKKTKKLITLVLAAAVLATALSAFAAEDVMPISAPLGPDETAEPVQDEPFMEAYPYYRSYSGEVKGIETDLPAEGAVRLTLESEQNGPANPYVPADAYIVGAELSEIAVGDRITLFYEADKPMIMIYPPQYNAAILLVNPDEDTLISADLFDAELLSRAGDLRLSIGEQTEVVLPDGTPFEGALENCLLLVYYKTAAESYPMQATPEKVVMLGKPEDLSEPYIPDVSTAELVVEGKLIEAPPAFTTDDGTIMVPLRAIAEALGYRVEWDGSTRTVYLNSAISLTIDRDYYVFMRMAPIYLGVAPAIRDSRTYVPLQYFREVLGLNNAYFFEGQIVIDNAEKME